MEIIEKVKYKGKIYEVGISCRQGMIMRLVNNKGYWLPVKNSLEDRLKNSKKV